MLKIQSKIGCIASKKDQSYQSYKKKKEVNKHERKDSAETVVQKRNIENEMSSVGTIKPVGKIRKNSLNCLASSTIPSTVNHSLPLHQESIKKYHDEIMSKIKLSQLTNYNKTTPLATKPEPSRTILQNGPRNYFTNKASIADYYETKMEVVLDNFQSRKKEIDEDIRAIKMKRQLKIVERQQKMIYKKTEVCNDKGQTPKFANSLSKANTISQSFKIVRTKKGSKWIEFLQVLRKQIQLQEILRNTKHILKDGDKAKIAQVLKVNFLISDVQAYTLDSQQFDPYYQHQQSLEPKKMAEELAKAWQDAQLHWKTRIRHRFQPTLLNSVYSEFEGEREKGCVSLKGLVRELGIMFQNVKYLRNRDLYRIYCRIWPFSRQKFLSQLGIQQQ